MKTEEIQKIACVVIVTWNSEHDIAECIQSILEQSWQNFKIIVVDNNSSDNTTNVVKTFSNKFKDTVYLIESKINTYFTGGNNIGIEFAKQNFSPEYIALINPDASASTSWLDISINKLEENEQIGMVAPKILLANKTDFGKINSAGMIFDGFLHAYDRGYGEIDSGQYDQDEYVELISGTAFVTKTKYLDQVGKFWEILKMYYEDVELSLRFKKNGFKLLYTHEAVVMHKYMQSTKNNMSVLKRNKILRNILFIGWRHYKLKSKIAITLKYIKGILNPSIEIKDL